MRAIKKPQEACPPRLDPNSHGVIDELAKNAEPAKRRLEGTPPKQAKYSFTRYRDDSVRQALEKLFHGKCAYCESLYAGTQPVDIEHFRPKSRVAEDPAFPGYWWLAADWDNLLPSCIDCNRSRKQHALSEKQLLELVDGATKQAIPRFNQGKADAFPLFENSPRANGPLGKRIIDAEDAILLNPTEPGYSFDQYFEYDFDSETCRKHGVVLRPRLNRDLESGAPRLDRKGTRALQTIMVCGLNRLALRQARHRTLIEIDFLISLFRRQLKIMKQFEQIVKELENVRKPHLSDSAENVLKLHIRQLDQIVEAIAFKTKPENEFSTMTIRYLEFRVPGFRNNVVTSQS